MAYCSLVVRFEHEAAPDVVLSAFASKWAKCSRPPFRRFGRTGSGEVLSADVIRRHCSFSADADDAIDLVFRTGRDRKSDVLTLSFWPPDPELDSHNFLAVDFRREDAGRAQGYDLDALGMLLSALVSSGSAWSGAVEFEEVSFHPEWQDSVGNRDFFRRPALGWIFFLPHRYLKKKRLPKWVMVLHEVENGLVVATNPEPLPPAVEIQRHQELIAKLDPKPRR